MNSTKIPKKEVLILTLGELLVSLLTVAVYLLIKKYDYTVLLGVLLGSAVSVLNFIFLSISVNRAVDRAVESEEFRRLAEASASKEDKSVEGSETESGEGSETESGENGDADDDGAAADAARFAAENQMKIQNAVRLSYTVRMASMVAALVVAGITKRFDIIATVVPLLMFRPILTVAVMLGRKES
ncbi:MAG: hypothetical protein IKD45_04635 [Clostridia bacterium]|nr:hypothetical protein [Clostridia bacterium]